VRLAAVERRLGRPGHVVILAALIGCGGAAASVSEEPCAGREGDGARAGSGGDDGAATTVAPEGPEDAAAAGADNPLDAEYAGAPALRTLEGRVSYYHDSLAGNPTASGEPYDPSAFTAANRTLPFGTIVRVVRRDTGATVVVRVNDRGPFGRRQRILDLSRAAAEKLDMIRAGVIDTRVEVLHEP
jgi:rare lipoprotein A